MPRRRSGHMSAGSESSGDDRNRHRELSDLRKDRVRQVAIEECLWLRAYNGRGIDLRLAQTSFNISGTFEANGSRSRTEGLVRVAQPRRRSWRWRRAVFSCQVRAHPAGAFLLCRLGLRLRFLRDFEPFVVAFCQVKLAQSGTNQSQNTLFSSSGNPIWIGVISGQRTHYA
jgi:hypothetical protein